LRAALWGIAALVWPLALSLLVANATATLVFYGIGLALDVVLFAGWLTRALRYGKRAARGETFFLQTPGAVARTRGITAKD